MSSSRQEEGLKPIIIGGGPVGLFMAIKLAKEHNVKVTLVDDRVNQYTRPGYLRKEVFEELSETLETEIKPSVAGHIKDLERELYNIARSLPNITIKYAKFTDLSADGTVKVQDVKLHKEEVLGKYDLIFDGTGNKRAVIEKVNAFENKETKSTPFHTVDIADNPYKSHLIAYGKMNMGDVEVLESKYDSMKYWPISKDKKEEYFAKLREFQEKTAWDSFSLPSFHILKSNPEKEKVTIYLETPSYFLELTDPIEKQAKLERYVHTFLGWVADKDIHFEKIEKISKYGSKQSQRLNNFMLQPTEIQPSHYQNDSILVIPIGDARIGVDYRMGTGIIRGVKENIDIIESCVIENGRILSIDLAKYEERLELLLAGHRSDVRSLYERMADEKKKLIIKNLEYKAESNYKKSDCKNIEGANEEKMNYLHTSVLQTANIIDLMTDPYESFEQKNMMKLKLNYVIKMANHFYEKSQMTNATKLYSLAIEMYEKYIDNKLNANYLEACEKMMSISSAANQTDDVIAYADRIMPEIKDDKSIIRDENSEIHALAAKILYEKMLALLTKACPYDSLTSSSGRMFDSQVDNPDTLKRTLKEVDELQARLKEYYVTALGDCKPKLSLPLQDKALMQYKLLQKKVEQLAGQSSELSGPSVVQSGVNPKS